MNDKSAKPEITLSDQLRTIQNLFNMSVTEIEIQEAGLKSTIANEGKFQTECKERAKELILRNGGWPDVLPHQIIALYGLDEEIQASILASNEKFKASMGELMLVVYTHDAPDGFRIHRMMPTRDMIEFGNRQVVDLFVGRISKGLYLREGDNKVTFLDENASILPVTNVAWYSKPGAKVSLAHSCSPFPASLFLVYLQGLADKVTYLGNMKVAIGTKEIEEIMGVERYPFGENVNVLISALETHEASEKRQNDEDAKMEALSPEDQEKVGVHCPS